MKKYSDNKTDYNKIIKKKIDSRSSVDPLTVSSNDYGHEPEDGDDMINRYGTYNIQPTANSFNDFPQIAQGKSRLTDAEEKD